MVRRFLHIHGTERDAEAFHAQGQGSPSQLINPWVAGGLWACMGVERFGKDGGQRWFFTQSA